MMKKTILLAAALLLGGFTIGNAQSVHPRIEIAGNFSNLVTHSSDAKDNTAGNKMLLGLRAGVMGEISLGGGIYVAPGLIFKNDGSKTEHSNKDMNLSYTHKTRLNYLSLPVDLGIRVELAPVAISVEAGPYFAYAINGKLTSNGKIGALDSGISINPFDDKDGDKSLFKRYDAGIGASAAVEFSNFQVRVGTDLGLINILKEDKKDYSVKNSDFYIGVGYRF